MEENTATVKKSNNTWIALFVVLLVLVGGIATFLLYSNNNTSTDATAIETTNATQNTIAPTQAPVGDSKKEIMIEGNEFAFAPATITVKKGEPVSITFKNTGTYPHDFSIKELDVKTKIINPGETDTISFVPDKTGNFEYDCTVDTHAEKGMVGILTVN